MSDEYSIFALYMTGKCANCKSTECGRTIEDKKKCLGKESGIEN